jgi:UDP-N-acetylglucosamine 2-epimerase
VTLVGTRSNVILEEVRKFLSDDCSGRERAILNPYGDGLASQRIVDALKSDFG